ncbi:MAG: hypothetical protein WAS36_01830 [Candidatus Saccharimonadales bacterium]
MTPEAFCMWMASETTRDPKSFSAEKIVQYKTAVVSHLIFAGLYAGTKEASHPTAGMRLTQSLGRATHSLVMLSASSEMRSNPSSIPLARALICEELSEYLCQNKPVNQTTIVERTLQVARALDELQLAQNLQHIPSFRFTIGEEIIATGSLFVSAAARSGRPGPGPGSVAIEPRLEVPVQRETALVL